MGATARPAARFRCLNDHNDQPWVAYHGVCTTPVSHAAEAVAGGGGGDAVMAAMAAVAAAVSAVAEVLRREK